MTTGESPKVRTQRLRRAGRDNHEEKPPAPPSVTAGPVEKIVDYLANPSRDKIREVTIIDRMQGRLFPQLDMINSGRAYILEIAEYRENKDAYKKKYKRERPIAPNLLDEYLFRSAQWQRSVAGQNAEKLVDIALAETEARAGMLEDNYGGKSDRWED